MENCGTFCLSTYESQILTVEDIFALEANQYSTFYLKIEGV